METIKNNVDALFYTGGTDIKVFETGNIDKTDTKIKFGLNNDYLFIFDKHNKIKKATRRSTNMANYSWKIFKNKIVINNEKEFINAVVAGSISLLDLIYRPHEKKDFGYPVRSNDKYIFPIWAKDYFSALAILDNFKSNYLFNDNYKLGNDFVR